MKTHARVVVIGGGAMGAGALYHLVKEGWSDVVLCEKGELTSGSTWHAAGLVPHFIGDLNMAKIHAYGVNLYDNVLEEETGQATGWHGCGAIRLAVDDNEVDWFYTVKGILDYLNIESHIIGPDEIKQLHPLLRTDGVKVGFYTPRDGHTDPSSSTNALARGARQGGAEIYRHNRVLDINARANGEWEVVTEKGTIIAEHVVNASGCFAPQINDMIDLKTPIVSVVHQYLVTENLDVVRGLENEPPVIRDPVASCYYRQEQEGILIGPYEMAEAQAWGLDGVDWTFDMELLAPDIDRLAPCLEEAAKRIPAFEHAGIKRIVSGPITHTPDGNFLLGPAGGVRNFWMCCGASIGVTQGPGAGKYLAQWMVHGQTEINMLEFDPRRYGDWAVGKYTLEKSIDEYQQMYQVHLPGEFREAGRPVKTTPIYEKLKAAGGQFAEVFGWERANWFSLDGEPEIHSFRRSNWFDSVAAECKAVRERVGILDLSSFAKFHVTGRDAESFLNRLCANRIPRREGGIVLTQMLGELGGIECEATISRVGENHYYVLSGAMAEVHDLDWMRLHLEDGDDVAIENVTESVGTLVLTGPRARDVLNKLTNADLTNESFPWLRSKDIDIAGVPTRALRISYVGELGWELHHPMQDMVKLYDALMEAGEEFGIANFGGYAMNAMRMEKAYRGWGSELTTEVGLVEADMERFANLDKGHFIGRDALVERMRKGAELKLVYCSVDAQDADPLGNEPVYDGDEVIGITTSGAYGHIVGETLAFAYVGPQYAHPGAEFDFLIIGERRRAKVLPEPAYDPSNLRLRS